MRSSAAPSQPFLCGYHPQPLATRSLLSGPVNSPVLDAPQGPSHSLCELLCPASFAEHRVVKVHPVKGCHACQDLLPVAASSSGGTTLGSCVQGVCCGHCLGVVHAVAVTTFVCGRAARFSGCPPGEQLAPHTGPLPGAVVRLGSRGALQENSWRLTRALCWVLSPASFIAWSCARLLFLHTLADTCRLRCFYQFF